MNLQAIEHINDSRYCFATGGNKYRVRLRTSKNDDIEKVECIWNSWNLIYKDSVTSQMELKHSDNLFDYYEVDIENKEPGYCYVFLISWKDGTKLYFSESGFRKKYDFTTCFSDGFQAPYPNDVDTIKQKHALDGRVYYQIFPDRFNRGSITKDCSYIDMKWDEEEVRNNHFMGGDLKGITDKLDYLSDLGIGAIYLNPIHPSNSAHKYDVNDYFGIDPMFGTADDFKELVTKAHEKDICIIMDMVFNHSAYMGNLFQDVIEKGKESKYYNWYFVDGDKPEYTKRNYLTFADVANMPKLNTNNPEVIEYFKDVVLYWKKKFGVDGFRLDVAFEVSHYFWRELKRALLQVDPEIIIYGEQWLNSESRLDNSEWDSVMNYPFRQAVMTYFKENKDNDYLSDNLNRILMRYKDTVNHNMINLFDSHDTERFLTTLKDNRDHYMMAYAINMFYPGNPEIYYGDEIFETGANDPYCRKGMKWDSDEYNGKDFEEFKSILHLRKKEALRSGEYHIESKDNVLLMTRYNKDEKISLAIYKGGKNNKFNCGKILLSRNYENGEFVNDGYVVYEE